MRIHYDAKVDALYLRLDDSKVVESEEVKPGIVLDFNAKKQVVGIEVLDLDLDQRRFDHEAKLHEFCGVGIGIEIGDEVDRSSLWNWTEAEVAVGIEMRF